MEELRSTEILDKEILEDARKKAERVLSKSEKNAKKILDAVPQRVETVKHEKEEMYKSKFVHFKQELDAALPLEKQRYLISFEDETVAKALENYISNLNQEQKLHIIEKLLIRYKDVLLGKKVCLKVNGFDLSLSEQRVKKILGEKSVISCSAISVAQEKFLSTTYDNSDGFIVESEDGIISCRAIIGEMLDEISDIYSYELATTLFGGRLPE